MPSGACAIIRCMARGHRRSNAIWRTRTPGSKYGGGWDFDKKKYRAKKLKAAGMTNVPKSKSHVRPAAPKGKVTVINGEPSETRQAWWWTLGRGGKCGGCSTSIAKGQQIAFRASDRGVRCQVCVDRENLTPQESKRFKAARAA